MHSWSPLTLEAGQDIENVVLVDTMSQLNQVVVDAGAAPPRVTAGGGASIEAILTALEANGLGWANSPAIGDISIAGHCRSVPTAPPIRQRGRR